MLRRVALVRSDVSEESRTTIFRLTRIGELEITLAVIFSSESASAAGYC
jgi:hypothetical protein